jgi:hypothetical protein
VIVSGIKAKLRTAMANGVIRKPLAQPSRRDKRNCKKILLESGVVARRLRDYLYSRYLHLFLFYDGPDSLQTRLAQLASDAAKESLPHLLGLLDELRTQQNQAREGELGLSDDTLHRLTRLRNALDASLPADVMKVIKKAEGSEPAGTAEPANKADNGESEKIKKKDAETQPADAVPATANPASASAKRSEAYEKWILDASPDVTAVAGALLEYHDLLKAAEFRGQADEYDEDGGRDGAQSASMDTDGSWSDRLRAAGQEAARSQGDLPRSMNEEPSAERKRVRGFAPIGRQVVIQNALFGNSIEELILSKEARSSDLRGPRNVVDQRSITIQNSGSIGEFNVDKTVEGSEYRVESHLGERPPVT